MPSLPLVKLKFSIPRWGTESEPRLHPSDDGNPTPCLLTSFPRLVDAHSPCAFVHRLVLTLWCDGVGQAGRAKAEADAVASAPAASTSGRLPSGAKDTSSATPAVIPLSSGRGLAIRYLQVLIDSSARTVTGGASSGGGMGDGGDASGRDGAAAVSSALHDELAYLLMEGLLVSRIRRSR